jgi:hypothetical protein
MKGVWGIKGPQEAGARGEVPRIVAERPDKLCVRSIQIFVVVRSVLCRGLVGL